MSAVLSFPNFWKRPAPAPAGTLLGVNAVEPEFLPGPYLKVGERGIFADVDGEQVLVGMSFNGTGSKVNPAKAQSQAHLFKASPDLFNVTEQTARLADEAYTLSERELRQRLAALQDAAEVALMRATGLLG